MYKETTTDGTTTTEADSAYALSLAGATLSEGSMVYGATEVTTTEQLEQLTVAQTVFEQRYNELSANDWYMVKAAFKPYSYTYDTNAAITESYINDDDSITEESVIYDYVLTQHYTNFETAVFVNPFVATSGAMGAVLFGYSYDGNLYFKSDDGNEYEWKLTSVDTKKNKITFHEFISSDEDTDENNIDESEEESIDATYKFIENGDNSSLTLVFETKNASILSAETIVLNFYPIEIGLTATE